MRFPIIHIEFDGMDVLQRHSQIPQVALNRSAMLGAEWIRALWINLAQRMDIRQTGAYVRGLQTEGSIRVVSSQRTGHIYEVVIEVVATAPHSSIVEEGHAAFHLPSKINWSATTGRVKRSKDGTPYMHIPFRHRAFATPEQADAQGLTRATRRAMMPEEIYSQAKRLQYVRPQNVGPIYRFPATQHGLRHDPELSQVMHTAGTMPRSHGAYTSAGGGVQQLAGRFQQADRYNWPKGARGRLDRSHTRPSIIGGDARAGIQPGGSGWGGAVEEHRGARLVGKDSSGNPMINPAWKSSKFHGLFKSGGKGHSQYMTIRTITPNSEGWHIPAQMGRFVAARVAAEANVNPALRDLVVEPIIAALRGGTP